MLRSLYTAATGMEAQTLNIDVIANNLANANTVGYKKGKANFQELLYQNVTTAGAASSDNYLVPTGIQVGLGVKPIAVQKVFQQGDFVQTGNTLDVVIQGDGFFQVTMPDGTTSYTRDGSFKLDNTGQIVTSDGYPLEPSITIPITTLTTTVGSDGKVSVTEAGTTTATQIGQIQIARFINPGGLNAIGSNLFTPSGSSGDPVTGNPGTEAFGTLQQGYTEMSNVNVVEEMVNMISSQRAYEMRAKDVTASDEMLQDANNMKSS